MGSIIDAPREISAISSPHETIPALDTRTDAEILTSLTKYKAPNHSEKNVWAFWDKGLAASPPWNQRCIISWVRRLGPEWTVRVLDLVPDSEVNVSKFVDDSHFPESFLQRKMEGKHKAPHMADLVRLPLVYLYGGIWMDVGFFLFRHLDDLVWDELSDPNTPYEMAGFKLSFTPVGYVPESSNIFNGFIAGRKGCVCIKYWHDTFVKLWEGRTTTAGMCKSNLLQHLPKYEPPATEHKMPNFMYEQFVDYIAQVFCLERLRHIKDTSLGWDGPKYFAENVLLFDCATQVYYAERLTRRDGRKTYNLLDRPREGVEQGQDWKESESFVEAILNTSSTMKISHGLAMPGREYLSEIWDKKENQDDDIKQGTWAAYLRWAGVYYENKVPLPKVLINTLEPALLEGPYLEVVGAPRVD